MNARNGASVGATAGQLLLAAERLFAEHGFAGVSLRQIAAAAGSANNSAVHYHFGSKERLVEAIFAYRLPQLRQRRALLKSRMAPDDLRARLEAQLLPVLELAESTDSSYLSFVEQLQRSAQPRRLFANQPQELKQTQQEFVDDICRLLPEVDEPVRTMRIHQVQMFSLHAAAQRERSLGAGAEGLIPFGFFVSSLIDGCAGYLAAPMSEETRRLLASADGAVAADLVRLI